MMSNGVVAAWNRDQVLAAKRGCIAGDHRGMKPSAAKLRRIHALDRKQRSQADDGRGEISTKALR
ncbi:hypothetical protein DY000_02045928 [Brassica cretica]|uniref:Uncharacterized protein n=1 Tax=Brassica cretica TaxID=69181 RepID=A0ABQ7ENP5_BRACR|nr:hypothetical protein DY000_02045928 [Brassica cretica]